MSLLEKFTLLFETDASQSAKEVRQLNDSLGDTDEEAKAATKQVNDLKKGIKDLITAYVGFKAIKAAVFDIARADDVVGKFSQTLGLNIEEVDAYGAAVERSGGSAESFRSSLSSLNDQLTELELTGAGDVAQTLSRLGINAADATGKIKGAFELLPEIAEAFEGLSAKESFGLGKRLGLDQGTILLLQQARNNMESLVEQQRQLGGRTKEGYQATADFNDELDNSARSFQAIFQSANTVLLPVLTDILKGFRGVGDWIKENQDLVTGFVIVVGGAITASLIPVMWRLAVATTAATWPFFLMAAVIGGVGIVFAALYEDVKAYTNGQESFIGKLLEKYQWLGDGIDAVMKGIGYAFEVLKQDIAWFGTLFTNPQEAINQLKEGIIEIIALTRTWLGLDDKKAPTELDPNAEDLPIFGSDNIISNTKKGLAMQSEYAASPVNSMSKSTAFNSQSRNQNINITLGEISVNAAGMSVGEAQSIFGDSLRNQISDALGYLNDGVVA